MKELNIYISEKLKINKDTNKRIDISKAEDKIQKLTEMWKESSMYIEIRNWLLGNDIEDINCFAPEDSFESFTPSEKKEIDKICCYDDFQLSKRLEKFDWQEIQEKSNKEPIFIMKTNTLLLLYGYFQAKEFMIFEKV